jgi:hypothetical protein
MESRSSERRTTQNTRNTQSRHYSAVSAVSAFIVVASMVGLAQQPDRAQTEALARRATERRRLQREADRPASQERRCSAS